jgi:ArsR family transcriptional regulator
MGTKATPHKGLHRALPPDAVEMIAARFKVLSEPIRLHLLMALEAGEKTVTELVEASGATPTGVSRHLQALARAGILARRKAGNSAFYRIIDPAIFELCNHVCGSLARQLDREAAAARWFR